MRERKDEKQLPIYESQPPKWLPKSHATADLGYPGFFPPKPGQDEDLLSETRVRTGFVLGHQVSAETFSAQSIINENLNAGDTLSKLEDLINEVFKRRADRIPSIPSPSFRMPTRVTLNEAKRQAWFADLANPDVPLHKLGKSVPHGAKGHDLLDLLHQNNVAIPRAVWFLRVFGANETAGLRNRPTYNPTQYSVDWANIMTGYMKKQLTDIALPSAPRPGLNIKQTFKGVLADIDGREKWISRFSYGLKLLRTFYAEGLVDHKTFLVWFVHQMGACNLAQAGFLSRLADEYLAPIMTSRAFARPFVEACLGKLSEIRNTAQEYLLDTEKQLRTILQRICLALPDAFVCPRMWLTHSGLITNVMNADIAEIHPRVERSTDRTIQEIRRAINDNLFDIQKRNEAILFHDPPSKDIGRLGTAVVDVKLLNSISATTDMSTISFFQNELDNTPAFKEKLDMLLTWSVTPLQYGDHRPFAAVTLIRLWRDRACERATRRDIEAPRDFLQDQLFDWLDMSEVAGESKNLRDVALLYGKLVKQELFSYAKYIQRLIARGEPGLSFTETVESRHRQFLGWIPLHNSTFSELNQRKVTLHGFKARETPEDITEREIRKEIRLILPELFGGEQDSTVTTSTALLDRCKTLVHATRFEQARTFRQWFLPRLEQQISRQLVELYFPGSTITSSALLRIYCISVELMVYAKCFDCILGLTLHILANTKHPELLVAIIDTLHRFATIWSCMNVIPDIVLALDTAHQTWKTQGVQSRGLLSLLVEFDRDRQYLSSTSRERIESDLAHFTLALRPATERPQPVPDVLPEILVMAADTEPEAPSLLANGLWIKYRTSLDWAWKVWDNAIASLRQVPAMNPDVAQRKACALRYGIFLWQVDQHLPDGLDGDVQRWFVGPGQNEIAALTAEAWDVVTVVLLYLCVHGALKTTTILTGVVYPAWQLGATESTPEVQVFLNAANNLFQQLLLQENPNTNGIPPVDLFDVQCLQTRRRTVYEEPHFSSLVTSIPLLILLENKPDIPQEIRTEFTSLRHRLCHDTQFRQGAYRNLDVIRAAFEDSAYLSETSSMDLGQHTIVGLRTILGENVDEKDMYDWPEVTCLLSPWKIVATTIQMQFAVKQLGKALDQESTHDAASGNLNKLTIMLFHQSMTSEEAYYVGEMAQGADNTFIANGFKCINELLQELKSEQMTSALDKLRRVGELLRALVYIAQPFRKEGPLLLNLDPAVQDDFVAILYDKLSTIKATLESSAPAQAAGREDLSSTISQQVVLLVRLLQFDLGFRGAWTPKLKDLSAPFISNLFYLALHYGTTDNLNPVVYPLLIDTLLYLIDEIPQPAKPLSFDPFRHYPNKPIAELPADLPFEYRTQILSLLATFSTNSAVTNLVNSHIDSSGNIVYDQAVVNRPWEWIEYLGEPSVLDGNTKDEDRDREEKLRLKTRYLVKNSGSLSLENFGAQMTGDGVVESLAKEDDAHIQNDIRAFEDGLSAEGIFARDWRESRVEVEQEASPTSVSSGRAMQSAGGGSGTGDADQESGSGSGHVRGERRTTPSRASPASSVVSRSSAKGSSSSLKQSPATRSLVDMEVDTSSQRNVAMKRKVEDDDEVEIIEGPATIRATAPTKRVKTGAGKTAGKTTGKTAGKTAGKTKAKKR
ncbi:hypothetical protein P691DRAFT_798859 [Macrolepiota fuliginosa MF-IS2]|uniref:Mediator of RNA polymerase II transcription subunit 12 n=1 Tax=Macrolepiota fuliginosa MF-IS2 TaxID=1400762 RepID=A0A9P5XLX0_9AGAR|nr:hypothetical protein P691DRAFT_798859 [Macrolepiota fuliginosa MF-IS2]